MKWAHIPGLPVAANVCQQELREVERQSAWSMAHVIMAPGATSLLHMHERMTEIYAIVRGYGYLTVGNLQYLVNPGAVVRIPPTVPHKLAAYEEASLEHLVFAFPPFDAADVHMVEDKAEYGRIQSALPSPMREASIEGGDVLAHCFADLDLSIAQGLVYNGSRAQKRPHYHKKLTEWIHVISGKGAVEVEGYPHGVRQGDWMQVDPGEAHILRTEEGAPMQVMCICHPRFDLSDVHYR